MLAAIVASVGALMLAQAVPASQSEVVCRADSEASRAWVTATAQRILSDNMFRAIRQGYGDPISCDGFVRGEKQRGAVSLVFSYGRVLTLQVNPTRGNVLRLAAPDGLLTRLGIVDAFKDYAGARGINIDWDHTYTPYPGIAVYRAPAGGGQASATFTKDRDGRIVAATLTMAK